MPSTEQIRFQTDVCYIESQGILKTSESTLKLNLSEQYILSYLIDNYGKPVTKDELLKVGWPDRIVTEASLFQVIRALRVKLNEEKKVMLLRHCLALAIKFVNSSAKLSIIQKMKTYRHLKR